MLVVRLTKNHPVPDGNKRAAWVALRLFVEMNDWSWDPFPTVDDAERAMLAIASGEWSESPPRVEANVPTLAAGNSSGVSSRGGLIKRLKRSRSAGERLGFLHRPPSPWDAAQAMLEGGVEDEETVDHRRGDHGRGAPC